MTTLVVAEQQNGILNPTTWETITLAKGIGHPVTVVVLGADIGTVADELANTNVDEVLVVEDSALEFYTADGFSMALEQVIRAEDPTLVLLSHTYQARDFVPALGARLGRTLLTDCTKVEVRDSVLIFTRPMFQGKMMADVRLTGPNPHLVTFQIGATQVDNIDLGVSSAVRRSFVVTLPTDQIRQRPELPFREAKQAVDLSQAERIVAVGRGIKSEEHLDLIRKFAVAMDAELAASRPICDAGWLPMDRQVGSSGQTVAPTLYFALGISGAIQHVVGMKGARTVVAINKDPDAPVFEIADYGIVGDLFEIVPAMIKALGE